MREIVWPVYRLSEKPPKQSDGVTFFSTEYESETGNKSLVLKIVDDLRVPGKTLGARRLYLLSDDSVKLHNIKLAIYFLQDLIKLAKSTTWFIDSAGKVFQYKKSTRAKLETKKISQILPAQGLGCVLEVQGLSQRFKCLTRPKTEEYVVLLYFDKAYLLYGFSDNPRPNSWRLV